MAALKNNGVEVERRSIDLLYASGRKVTLELSLRSTGTILYKRKGGTWKIFLRKATFKLSDLSDTDIKNQLYNLG